MVTKSNKYTGNVNKRYKLIKKQLKQGIKSSILMDNEFNDKVIKKLTKQGYKITYIIDIDFMNHYRVSK